DRALDAIGLGLDNVPPSVSDFYLRGDGGPSELQIRAACNGSSESGSLCMKMEADHLAARGAIATKHVAWWTNQVAQVLGAFNNLAGEIGKLEGLKPGNTPRIICQGGKCGLDVSCFTAGTSVDTDSGPVAIEDIRPGQRVESLDAAQCTEPVDPASC